MAVQPESGPLECKKKSEEPTLIVGSIELKLLTQLRKRRKNCVLRRIWWDFYTENNLW